VNCANGLYTSPVRTTLRFAIIAGGFAWLMFRARSPIALAIFGHATLSFVVVTAGYAWLGPLVYAKSARTGLLPWLAWLALLPVHALNALAFGLVIRLSDEHPADEVLPGVLLGRRLARNEKVLLETWGARSVLDLTSEFQDPPFVRALAYRAIPVLDDAGPTSAQLHEGVAFLLAAPKPVYVHCALGHGRSATFVAALALATGAVKDPASAVALLRTKRPGVRLSSGQRAALAAFTPATAAAPLP